MLLHKRRYHPLIILLFHSGILTTDQIKELPKTTKYNWKGFQHENYYGYHLVSDYIQQFDDIKTVYARKNLFRTVRLICNVSDGYHGTLDELNQKQKVLREQANKLVSAIERTVKYAGISARKVCRIFKVDEDWYYRQKQKLSCSLSKIGQCFKQVPNQLTLQEAGVIEEIVCEAKNKGRTLATLYYKAMWDGLIFCARSTFYKYAHLLGYEKPERKENKRCPNHFRASRPFEWLHVDTTQVKTIRRGIQYVVFIKDNFSKAILNYISLDRPVKSGDIKGLFVRTFEKYNLHNNKDPISIGSDGGSENKGEFMHWIGNLKAPPVVNKITAGTLGLHSNNMSESLHKIFKSEFLKGKDAETREEHVKLLDLFVNDYQHYRYPVELFGYTPAQVLNGAIPDRRLFTEKIKEAGKKRIISNQNFNKCPIC